VVEIEHNKILSLKTNQKATQMLLKNDSFHISMNSFLFVAITGFSNYGFPPRN